MPHPDDVDDALSGLLMVWHGGEGSDAYWTHHLEQDPGEMEKFRRHQIMALARYARAPLLEWGGVDVSELRAWYDELKELLQAEKKTNLEDQ